MAGPATPTFAADAMLGRLAKWLRLIGLDTTYDPAWRDEALLRHATAEGRILLTRDTRLLRRRRLPEHLFIRSDDVREQMREVLTRHPVDPLAGLLHLCSRCNVPLVALEADRARAFVPAHVARTQTRFATCPCCGRVYWPATHVARILSELVRMGLTQGGEGAA